MAKLKLTATLKDSYGNVLSGKPIDFYYSYDNATYTKITSQTTDVNGNAETTHETNRTTWYKAAFAGDSTYAGSEAVQKYEVSLIPPEFFSQFTSMITTMFTLYMLMMLMSMVKRLREKR